MRTFFKLPRLIVHRNVTTPIYKLQFFIHFIFVQRFSHFLRETTKKKIFANNFNNRIYAMKVGGAGVSNSLINEKDVN